jgi:hypothetical protein
MTNLIEIKNEIDKELANKEVLSTLVATTFKGLQPPQVRSALMEGMIRGFKFQDFLVKNVYAIPFKEGYSLITSVDYARKIGMRSNVIGKSEPIYEEKDGRIISCAVTIKRKVGNEIGDFTAKVYFAEYTTNRNLWTSKPRTMIAKVAEMHALRMACPEEMAQVYVEEEMEKGNVVEATAVISEELIKKVEATKTEADLKAIWEANKGLGKDFAKLVTTQKKFINDVKKDENANS